MVITQKQIAKEVLVPTSLTEVWQDWATAAGVSAFMGIEATIELKLGGAYEWLFEAGEPGLRGSEGCTIISFVPFEMISFTWNAPPSMPLVRNHEHKTWVTIFFNEGTNGTHVRLIHTGWPSGEAWHQAFEYFNNAWAYVLNTEKRYWEQKTS